MYATLDIDTNLTDTMTSTGDDAVELRPDFSEFYRSEYPNLISVACALAGNRADGEDLVQDTMVRTLINWRKVGGFERPGGWCHRVLVNACRSWARRRRTAMNYLARQRRVEASSPGPSTEVMEFWEAVRRLPERPRQVVALYYAGDRSVAEVAHILNVPEGTVRSDLTRARVALMNDLEP